MGFMDIGERTGNALGAILGATVVLLVIAAVIGLLFSAVGDVNVVFTDNASDLNNSVATSVAPVFPIIIGVSVLLAIVSLILGAISLRS